jgi:hypothetical protein
MENIPGRSDNFENDDDQPARQSRFARGVGRIARRAIDWLSEGIDSPRQSQAIGMHELDGSDLLSMHNNVEFGPVELLDAIKERGITPHPHDL